VPTSSGSKPRIALPMVAHAALRAMMTWRLVICSGLSWRQTVQTVVSDVVPLYVQIRLTRRAHCFTGHKTGSSVRPCVTVSFLASFFCISKVTETQSANSNSSDGVSIRRPSLKNLIFLRQRSLVLFCSRLGTREYSHDRQAKKPAIIVSWDTAWSSSDTCLFASSSSTQKGSAFCCSWLGSSFL